MLSAAGGVLGSPSGSASPWRPWRLVPGLRLDAPPLYIAVALGGQRRGRGGRPA